MPPDKDAIHTKVSRMIGELVGMIRMFKGASAAASDGGNRAVVMPSRYDLPDHASMHIGEAVVAASVAVSEAFVIETQEVQDGGVQVVDVNFVFDGVPAELE